MKQLFIATLLLTSISFAQISSSDTTPVLPHFASLKDAMKDMSKKLKAISSQAKDPSKNASSEKLSTDLMNSVMAAKLIIPDSAPDKASVDMYTKMMDDTIALTKQLSESFHKNDNAQAIQMLNKLSDAKKDGHAEFNK